MKKRDGRGRKKEIRNMDLNELLVSMFDDYLGCNSRDLNNRMGDMTAIADLRELLEYMGLNHDPRFKVLINEIYKEKMAALEEKERWKKFVNRLIELAENAVMIDYWEN